MLRPVAGRPSGEAAAEPTREAAGEPTGEPEEQPWQGHGPELGAPLDGTDPGGRRPPHGPPLGPPLDKQ